MELTSKQRAQLRGLANSIDTILQDCIHHPVYTAVFLVNTVFRKEFISVLSFFKAVLIL